MDNKLFDKFGKDQLLLNILKALKDKKFLTAEDREQLESFESTDSEIEDFTFIDYIKGGM